MRYRLLCAVVVCTAAAGCTGAGREAGGTGAGGASGAPPGPASAATSTSPTPAAPSGTRNSPLSPGALPKHPGEAVVLEVARHDRPIVVPVFRALRYRVTAACLGKGELVVTDVQKKVVAKTVCDGVPLDARVLTDKMNQHVRVVVAPGTEYLLGITRVA